MCLLADSSCLVDFFRMLPLGIIVHMKNNNKHVTRTPQLIRCSELPKGFERVYTHNTTITTTTSTTTNNKTNDTNTKQFHIGARQNMHLHLAPTSARGLFLSFMFSADDAPAWSELRRSKRVRKLFLKLEAGRCRVRCTDVQKRIPYGTTRTKNVFRASIFRARQARGGGGSHTQNKHPLDDIFRPLTNRPHHVTTSEP